MQKQRERGGEEEGRDRTNLGVDSMAGAKAADHKVSKPRKVERMLCPTQGLSDLYERMSGKGAGASEAHRRPSRRSFHV